MAVVVVACVSAGLAHADEMIRKRPDLNPDALKKAKELADIRDRIMTAPTAAQKTTLDLAKEIAQASRKHMIAPEPEVNTPQELRKDGVYLLLSFSLPEHTLKEYFRESSKYGIPICLRGLVDNSFKKTRERILQLMLDEHQKPDDSALTGLVIDPVIYQRAGVNEVPALVVVEGEHYQSVVGTASIQHLFGLLAKQESGLHLLAQWMDQRDKSWVQGGPTTEPRPSVLTLGGTRQVRSDFATWAIAEQDMLKLFKEKLAKMDWEAFQKKSAQMVKRKLEKGPGLDALKAERPRRFTVDLTTEFPEDIKDPSNNTILVKAGSRVNPLTQVTLPYSMMIFDATDTAQVRWAEGYMREHPKEMFKVSVTKGNIEPLMTKIHHRVFWMTDELMRRFQITAVPSVVRQIGSMLEVQEYVAR